MGDAWAAVSTLISGVVVWGGIGWGIDYLAGTKPVGFAIGAVVGNFAAIYLIYAKQLKESSDAS
jgi:F0F1-type ATP synthase assembly protein I